MTTTQTKPRPFRNPFPRKRFGGIDVTFDAIASLRPAVARLRERNRHLADQISRALTNVSLNLGEGATAPVEIAPSLTAARRAKPTKRWSASRPPWSGAISR